MRMRLLTVLNHALEKKARNKETESGHADEQRDTIDSGKNDDADKPQKSKGEA